MSIHIKLDNVHRTYSPGEVVTGRVLLWNMEREKVKEVRVKLVFSERNEVAERSHSLSNKISEPSHSETDSSPEEIFPYLFRFQLPGNLPSSRKSTKGEIIYFLEAELKLRRPPLFHKTNKISLPITINGVLDLNLVLDAHHPQSSNEANYLQCSSRDVSLCLQLPLRSSFVPGEILEFHAFINNSNSSRRVTGVEASIVQVTNYNSKHGVMAYFTNYTVNRVPGPTLNQGQTNLWKSRDLIIPEVTPTGFGRRSLGGRVPLIDLKYFLHVQILISGLDSRPLIGELPIVIGTVPLRPALGRGESGRAGLGTPQDIFGTPNSSPPSAPILELRPPSPVLETYIDPTAPDELSILEDPAMDPPRYEDVAAPPSYSEAVRLLLNEASL